MRAEFSRQAVQDLAEIADYISQHSVDAAINILDTLRQKCDFLATHSEFGERWTADDRQVRFFNVGSYVIFYRPTSFGIEVARVMHGARDLTELF